MTTVTNPYNKTNVLITSENIKQILGRYNVVTDIKDISLFTEAMTDESYCKITYTTQQIEQWTKELDNTVFRFVPLQERTYQIKEFLGDIIIKAIITDYITQRFNDPTIHTEGFLTPLKARLEDTHALSKFSRILGLGKYLLISNSVEDNNGRDSEKLLEDTFEAFMGALYLDQGFDLVKKLLWKFLETEIDYAEILRENTNYMQRLQNFYHSNGWSHPVYHDIDTAKINGKNFYTVAVKTFDGNIIESTTVVAQNKSKAKQESAKHALKYFNQ